MNDLYLGWIVGLIEGDGSIYGEYSHPIISVSMTDRDVIQRISNILEVSYNRRPKTDAEREKKYLQQYRIYVCGNKARKLLNSIYPYMSKRRKKRIRTLLKVNRKRKEVSNDFELGWISGIVESEGSIQKERKRIIINMVDKDVITRVTKIWESDIKCYGSTSTGKLIYTTFINRDQAIPFIKKIRDLLGKRKQLQSNFI